MKKPPGTCSLVLVLLNLYLASAATLLGFTPIGSGSFERSDGSWVVVRDSATELQLFGTEFDTLSEVVITKDPQDCDRVVWKGDITLLSNNTGTINVLIPENEADDDVYFCLNDVHQGTTPGVTLGTKTGKDLIPLPVSIILLIILLCMSGLFSGLNLGLMALSPNELEIVVDSGDEDEKRYAKAILPLRKRGNLLLCTILLGNVLVNSTLTILLDGLAGGIAAVLGSTAAIVVFGEITPQSVCSRHGLYVGAKTIWLTKFFLVVTFPVAYPISKVLDLILGEEIGTIYQRSQLLQLVRIQEQYNDLDRNEMGIITGALTFKDKTVQDIMTPITDVFMLDITSVLDFKTVQRIMDSGHSRIPVYRDVRDNIVGLLYVKDLAFLDPDDRTPLESIIKFYKHRLEQVYHDTRLDVMLDKFKQGQTHMVVVTAIRDQGDKDPVREIIGICTLEDVIEEIIQAEIIDETDRVVDNVSKKRVDRHEGGLAVLAAAIKGPQEESKVSDQMALAIFTFLTTSVEPFASHQLLPSVVRKMIHMPRSQIEIEKETSEESDLILYSPDTPLRTFTLVLEGKLKVTVGKEEFSFAAGPFHALGLSALTDKHAVSDFKAVVDSERVLLWQVSYPQYQHAVSLSRKAVSQGVSSPMIRPKDQENGADEDVLQMDVDQEDIPSEDQLDNQELDDSPLLGDKKQDESIV